MLIIPTRLLGRKIHPFFGLKLNSGCDIFYLMKEKDKVWGYLWGYAKKIELSKRNYSL